ncbi:MAG: ATP-binding protein [Pseudomonadota bacterium]|nr:ATP-binding protein [Pseudomonadota bacterium]
MFKTGSPVKGNEFIDRKKHIPVFQACLKNGQHTTIKAPRRFGKTSLAKHVLEHIGGYQYIYIDIRRAMTLEQLANTIINSAYELVGIQNFIRKAKETSLELLKSIQKIKVESIGEITLQMQQASVNEMELFLHALDLVEKIGEKQGANIVFVMDEFQDIKRLGDKHILDTMRSVMQHHENVTYIFMGSIESMMTYIFENKESPFFHFTKMMHLQGLDIDELFEYCVSFFGWEKYKVNENDLLALLTFLEGHPDYSARTLQQIYYTLLQNPKLEVNRELCIQSLTATFIDNKAYLEELASKAKQKKNHFEVLYATANGIEIDLPSATLYHARTSLEDMGLLRNVGRGQYEVVDVFLKIFLFIEQTDSEDVIEFLEENI